MLTVSLPENLAEIAGSPCYCAVRSDEPRSVERERTVGADDLYRVCAQRLGIGVAEAERRYAVVEGPPYGRWLILGLAER